MERERRWKSASRPAGVNLMAHCTRSLTDRPIDPGVFCINYQRLKTAFTDWNHFDQPWSYKNNRQHRPMHRNDRDTRFGPKLTLAQSRTHSSQATTGDPTRVSNWPGSSNVTFVRPHVTHAVKTGCKLCRLQEILKH